MKLTQTTERPTWHEYFLSIAAAVATRADCTRRKAGAVLVKNNRIVATGYNGSPAGDKGCLTDGACPRGHLAYSDLPPSSSYDTGPGTCIAVHAEANCLLYADRDRTEGGTLYVTGVPCPGCEKLLRASGVRMVVWPGGFMDCSKPKGAVYDNALA
jgi:dCMP deaminase